jgi:flagellar biosynthesis/type III secretory pathway protein FliH
LSPEARTLALPRPPSDARLFAGSLDDFVAARIAARAAEARAQGERDAAERAARALEAACARLDAAREEAAANLALHAVQLALDVAQTLVRREVAAGRHDLEAMVRESLAVSGVGRGECVVHLNPLDAESVAGVRFRAGTRIEADEAVRRGDVQISTPHGLLVREIPEALRAIHDRLLGELS